MRKLCYIVGAGSTDGMCIAPDEKDFVIAADGGYAALCRVGVRPKLAVGDFDSLGYLPENIEVLRHPPEKDDTDMALAICEGRARGFDNFVIYGGLGGRLDHSIANLQTICRISRENARAWLWGENTAATAVTNAAIRFPGKCKGMFSVFAHGDEATGVNLSDCKYELCDAVLNPDVPLGVSNEFTGEELSIGVSNGTLIILWSCSSEEFEQMIKEGYC